MPSNQEHFGTYSVMQKAFFDALRNGRAAQAAKLLSEWLVKNSAPASLIESVRWIQEDLQDKLSESCPPEKRQRIEEYYAAKLLDIWEQCEKNPRDTHASKPFPDRLIKGFWLLVVVSVLLMIIEIVAW
ncbi:MAG: hypothetical protein IPH16_11730 [Haliscomenobacter sp.]|nr:hypothetical protein [Haliscomenobacter sp.]MBK7474631.1 hypothetical protein [Haliscomenobacter sp.]MBK8877723.1 hypothetical protein [Haliscomenobacter sp.]